MMEREMEGGMEGGEKIDLTLMNLGMSRSIFYLCFLVLFVFAGI